MAKLISPLAYADRVKLANPNIVLKHDFINWQSSIPCLCSACGYGGDGSWKVNPQNLLKPDVCPICAGRPINRFYQGINDLETWCKKNDRQDILDDWDYDENKRDPLTPDFPRDIARSNPKIKIHWKCSICGTRWENTTNKRTSIDRRSHHTSGCPHCAKAGTSFSEQALLYYLSDYFPDIEHRNTTHLGKELDVFIPSKKIAVEFDGYLYHKDKLDADNAKDSLCHDSDIKLVRLRDSRLPKTISAVNITCDSIQNASNFEKAIEEVLFLCDIKIPKRIDIKKDYGKIISRYKTAVLSHNLLQEHPNIAEEWHPSKNGSLRPENFTSGEDYYAWWKCKKCGHEWQAHIYSRTGTQTENGKGCPECALKKQGQTYRKNRAKLMDFETWCISHDKSYLLKEWDYEANLADEQCPNTPKDCPFGSPQDVHWVCQKCEYKWLAPPVFRRRGCYPCPNCRGKVLYPGINDLETWCIENNREDILADWDLEKNSANEKCPNTPKDARFDLAIYVFWKCHICGHEWRGRIGDRTKRNKNCRDCVIAHRGKRQQRRVRNIETGEVFNSVNEAQLKYGGKLGSTISNCCCGRHNTAYGYHWEYVDIIESGSNDKQV